MNLSPLALLIRLVPLLWIVAIFTADATALQKAAHAAAYASNGIPWEDSIRTIAAHAREAILEGAAPTGDARDPAGVLGNLMPSQWLLSRTNAVEAIVLLILARLASGARLLLVTFVFWLAAVNDGLVERRVAFLTFRPYRPIVSVTAGNIAVLFLAAAVTVLASPLAGSETAAVLFATVAAVMANLWVRSFHRFEG